MTQYMLPACKSVYHDLARLDPLYDQLYRMLLSEENGVLRYGKRFYEEFSKKRRYAECTDETGMTEQEFRRICEQSMGDAFLLNLSTVCTCYEAEKRVKYALFG